MNRSRFQSRRHAAPVFTCDNCGHSTRLVSDAEGICEHCYELAGIDNYFNDSDRKHTSTEAAGYLAEANRRIAELRKNGGDAVAARAKESCPYIWPTT